jgi:hypothetical protein
MHGHAMKQAPSWTLLPHLPDQFLLALPLFKQILQEEANNPTSETKTVQSLHRQVAVEGKKPIQSHRKLHKM